MVYFDFGFLLDDLVYSKLTFSQVVFIYYLDDCLWVKLQLLWIVELLWVIQILLVYQFA